MCKVIQTGFPHLAADSFESSLASDEVLVHFFNDFLSLPCFPDSLVFNQISGQLEVVSGAAGVVSSRTRSAVPTAPSTTPKVDLQYTVQCLDREEGMQWIKRERLPSFFDSDCYHEYRLAKVLFQWDWKKREVGSGGPHQEQVDCSTGVCCLLSGPGLRDFREFLRGKAGEKVLNLWMDIERLKVTRCEERKKRYLALMRIWYLMSSSPTCLNEELLSRLGLTTSLCWTEEKLQSAQSYLHDALLHYWGPRFLTSRRVQESIPDRLPLVQHTGCYHMSHSSTPSCHGSSAPPLLRADACWTPSSSTVHKQLQFIGGEDQLRRTEKMFQALCAESRSGFYFTHFCEQSGNQLWVNAVYCWTDLQHYHKLFYPDGRDPYRVEREAEFLHSTYISYSARRSVAVDQEIRGEVYDQLRSASEEMFDRVEKHVLQILLEPWTLLVNKNKRSFQQVCVHEEVRHIDSQEFRELQSLSQESEQQLKQQTTSKSHKLSESWSRVAPEYQGYRLGSLLRCHNEIDHFMSFLRRQKASIHLSCWLDLEQYRRTSQRDKEGRQKKSRHIVTKYLNTKYFFSPDSPATAEQQDNVKQMIGRPERLKYDCLSNKVVVEIRDIIRTYIEATWLPLFLSTPEFTELRLKQKTEGLWMSSSKEIMQFRGALLNPVTCQLFQLFLSTKGDFLENDLRFWLEVQKYKDIYDCHNDEATIQKKVSTIISCFINSSMPPALQIHIPPEEAQNILDNCDELDPYVFREAQMSVFRELLKHWPEFQECVNSMEEEQLVPLLQEKREKYRARVRRQRRKEEDASRAWEELQSRDSSSIEEEERQKKRKQSRKQSKLTWLFSKYMTGLKKEEVMLRKQSQSSSETGTAWRSRSTLNPNPANCVITAVAWTRATRPAPPSRAKKPPENAPHRLPPSSHLSPCTHPRSPAPPRLPSSSRPPPSSRLSPCFRTPSCLSPCPRPSIVPHCPRPSIVPPCPRPSIVPPCPRPSIRPPCPRPSIVPHCPPPSIVPPCPPPSIVPPCPRPSIVPPCPRPSIVPHCPRPSIVPPCPRPSIVPPCPPPSIVSPCPRPSIVPPCPRPSIVPPCPRPSIVPPCPRPSIVSPCPRPSIVPPCPRPSIVPHCPRPSIVPPCPRPSIVPHCPPPSIVPPCPPPSIVPPCPRPSIVPPCPRPSIVPHCPRPSIVPPCPRPSIVPPCPPPSIVSPCPRPSIVPPCPRPSIVPPCPRPSIVPPCPRPSIVSPCPRPSIVPPCPRPSIVPHCPRPSIVPPCPRPSIVPPCPRPSIVPPCPRPSIVPSCPRPSIVPPCPRRCPPPPHLPPCPRPSIVPPCPRPSIVPPCPRPSIVPPCPRPSIRPHFPPPPNLPPCPRRSIAPPCPRPSIRLPCPRRCPPPCVPPCPRSLILPSCLRTHTPSIPRLSPCPRASIVSPCPRPSIVPPCPRASIVPPCPRPSILSPCSRRCPQEQRDRHKKRGEICVKWKQY